VPGPRLILASASPRRQDLLRESGYEFTVDAADIDEANVPHGLAPSALAERLAIAKARAVATRHPEDVVLAADTIVVFGERVLGKPLDQADARRMLAMLEGTTHIVITGVALAWITGDYMTSRRAMSAVRMRRLTSREVDEYVDTGQWQGKAGGYGIQDPDPFVTRMSGSHTNVVGLPIELVKQMLGEAGVFPAAVPSAPAHPTP
jgi:septum formation protein